MNYYLGVLFTKTFDISPEIIMQWRPGIDLVVCNLECHVIGLITVSLGHIYPYLRSPYVSDLGLSPPHFEFFSLYLNMFDQNLQFLCKKLQFL